MQNLLINFRSLFKHQIICKGKLNILNKSNTRAVHKMTEIKDINKEKNIIGTKKLTTIQIQDETMFQGLFTNGLKDVISLFKRYNFELRITGGAVRDLLMGLKPVDIDFATTATPSEMFDMFTKEGVRMLNKNGLKHGTITCRLCEENFEITSLRIDYITDGRHAEVKYITDWAVDASRRDFTVNAMYLDFNGTVYDYFSGIDDIRNNKLKFVGNPVDRIQEDYLRILRYFRFYGKISLSPFLHDPLVLTAIKENMYGLDGISGPRIWDEMTKIFKGKWMIEIIKTMNNIGLLKYVGLPTDMNMELFEEKFAATRHLDIFHMTYIAALLKDMKDMVRLEKRVLFSKREREVAAFIILFRNYVKPNETDKVKCYQDIIFDNNKKIPDAKWHVCELLKYNGDIQLIPEIRDWEVPNLPINGKALKEIGVKKGKQFGVILEILKEKWKKSNFTISREDLLKLALETYDNINNSSSTKS